jgi:hypothetical protein
MVSISLFRLRNPSNTHLQIVARLYLQIFGLVTQSLLLGMFLILIARESGRGDPNQILRLFELTMCLLIVGVASASLVVHRGIQALSKFGA